MLGLLPVHDTRSHVSSDGTFEDFQHEAEEVACQCGIPPAFGALVTDEGVLRLDLQKLDLLFSTHSIGARR